MKYERVTRIACALTILFASFARAQTQELPLKAGWRLQSSEVAGTDGARISSLAFDPAGWIATTVPATVVGAQVEAGIFKDPFFGHNFRSLPGMTYPPGVILSYRDLDPASPYARPWWYRRVFALPASYHGKRIVLHFNGINYRANIWLNGQLVADSADVAGAFRRYEFDITPQISQSGQNVLAVAVYAPTSMDLATTWLDWNPEPPDKMMGLWHEVYLSASGDVVIRYPQVISRVDTASLNSADLTVGTLLRNLAEHSVSGVLRGHIGDIAFEKSVTLGAHDSAYVTFTPESFSKLHVSHPQLWWPPELGTPVLHTLSLSFVSNGAISDAQSIRFGIRQITSEFMPAGGLLLRINGKRLLVRGGGWAGDLFWRPQPERQLKQMRYALDLQLNTLRLEGQLENDQFWQRADSMGILIMAGWPCCTVFEKWSTWKNEQHVVAAQSQRDQMRRLRAHPSALVWLNGSDKAPPADVEKKYIDMLVQEHWPNPYISSASAASSTVTGPSGVKMTGPYDWVPPSYWLLDKKHGGAWAYNTETSPGAAVPPLASLQRFIPEKDLWPIDSVWSLHAADGARFNKLTRFTTALNERYGTASGVRDYADKSQLMTYEGERAMFEAYRRNKYTATGVIQWMYNNAWPSVYWHLFDWYLRPGGGYFGAKKANEPLHVMYSYDDASVAIVSALRRPASHLRLRAHVLNLDGTEKFIRDTLVDVPADSALRVFTIPQIDGLSRTYFVDLRLTRADTLVSSNLYWLSTHPDQMDLDSTNNFVSATKQYADFTALRSLPTAHVRSSVTYVRQGSEEKARVTLSNSGKMLAFFVHPEIHAGAKGDEVLPVLWSDNYVTLLPGETRVLTAGYAVADLRGAKAVLRVNGWNLR